MKRAILMARVSSDEQAKGYSLDIQVDKLSSHCSREGIQVLNVYREDHSAKNFNRPEFKKLLTYLKANKGKVDLLLVTSWDRFSRNVTESFATIEKLRLLGVEVQAIEQPLDLSVPENLMILSVYLTLPDIDNKRRSIKITEGVRAARAAGRWIGKPPFGYKKARDEKDKAILVPNEQAALVRKAFQLIAGGKSQADLTTYLKKKGANLPKSTLSDLLRNQVYIGNIWVQSEGGGFYVKGVHPPLIEEALFHRAQERLEAHLQKKNFTKAKAFKPELHLRGLLLCDNCGEHLTGSASKARNGEHHHYYHCNHCGEVRVRAADTHQRMEAILGEFRIKEGAVKLYEKMVKGMLANEGKKKRPLSKIQEEISQNEQRLKNIQDDFADRLIDIDTYQHSKARYQGELKKLNEELGSLKEGNTDVQKLLKKGLHLLQQLPQFYQKSSVEVKRELLGSIFPEKLLISKTKSRTTKINSAVLLITATDKDLSENENGQLYKNVELSGSVEVTGVEPQFMSALKALAELQFSAPSRK